MKVLTASDVRKLWSLIFDEEGILKMPFRFGMYTNSLYVRNDVKNHSLSKKGNKQKMLLVSDKQRPLESKKRLCTILALIRYRMEPISKLSQNVTY